MTRSALPLTQEAATPPPTTRRLVRLKVGAAYAGVDHQTLRRRIADGSISGYRAGKTLVLVDLNELDSVYLQRIPTASSS